ncbi:hypothetical protein I2I05_20545 [Hymenobacter sp. BT683]|uniref:Uncharacterized protein n=1 Tax=Hymenobacter jeongseonensis TaxID=2791027 RepID=A0ABS0IPV7_9BACT|nr:hypothetical protein [Hymenobacter jeongseonensis]MBF9239795.1 hypothetical protein [Hymenobacter jeongseonensis]
MSELVFLEERILACDWDVSGGSLEYDISDLHPDFDVLIQSYTVESVDFEGRLVYGSEFLFFKKGRKIPSNLSRYPKAIKAALWQIVFSVKRKFFEEIKPDIVLHFIKQPHSVEERFKLYSKYLNLPNYTIEKSKHEIIYTKTTSTGNDGGFRL